MSALDRLAAELRGDEVIGPHVTDSDDAAALGRLAAAGPRAADAGEEYTLLFEAIREGFLLHYGEPRLLAGPDPDLRLLAGDYLYALGLQRLAARGDLEAVCELGDLISLSAQIHARGDAGAGVPLWLAGAVAVGSGGSEAHARAKRALRDGAPDAADKLADAAAARAAETGVGRALADAADSIGFRRESPPSERG